VDALEADHLIPYPVDLFYGSAKDNHLQAMVMVQVNMEGGNRLQQVRVLEVKEFVRQLGDVVIVDQDYGRHGLGIGSSSLAALRS